MRQKAVARVWLLCCLNLLATPLFAGAVQSFRIIAPEKASAVAAQIASLLARRIEKRCGAKADKDAALVLELAVEPKAPAEGFTIADRDGGVRIIGNDERGLLYGVGKFLHTSRFDADGFTPGAFRGSSAPQCKFRGLYAAVHYMNWYEAAPLDEVQEYVEDMGLWGVNIIAVHFPTWNFDGYDDPAAKKNLDRLRDIFKCARGIGLEIGFLQVPNQGFKTTPQDIRFTKFPDTQGRHGYFGVNCCPSTPAGHDYLIKEFDEGLAQFKETGLDWIIMWPYDEGGCGCKDCSPWGARGYAKLSKECCLLARKHFPTCKTVLSTWTYDTPPGGEWEGLTQFLSEDKSWLDYIMADAHEDFPRYPIEKGVPGGLPLTNFPEISMWGPGRPIWGGFGANPFPARLDRLAKQTEGKLQGGLPYSEGIYEDINKIVCFQRYWHGDAATENTLKEYAAYEFSPDVAEDVLKAIHLFEENWAKLGPKAGEPLEILTRAESKMTPQAKAAWRWRILMLRAIIDKELLATNRKYTGPVLKAAFDEMTRISHAENAHSQPLKPPQLK
jgi:hypothetical protein